MTIRDGEEREMVPGGSTNTQTKRTKSFIPLDVIGRVMAPQRCPGPIPWNL